MEENILASIKQMIGSEEDYSHFDKPIIQVINTAFSILFQVGVGPKDKPFKLLDGSETWDEFTDEEHLDMVKSYIATKVQQEFDPPANSFVMTALQDRAKEYEWRLNVADETP